MLLPKQKKTRTNTLELGDRDNPFCPQHVEPNTAVHDVSADSRVLVAPVADEDFEVVAGDCNTTNCTDKSEDSVEHNLTPEGSEQE